MNAAQHNATCRDIDTSRRGRIMWATSEAHAALVVARRLVAILSDQGAPAADMALALARRSAAQVRYDRALNAYNRHPQKAVRFR